MRSPPNAPKPQFPQAGGNFTVKFGGAAPTLEVALPRPAQKVPPGPPMLYQIGLTRAALGHLPGAIEALRKALDMRPGMKDAWLKLAELLVQTGDGPGARAARRQADAATEAAPVPPQPTLSAITTAEREWGARLTGQAPQAANAMLRTHLATTNPTDVAAMLKLARIFRQAPDLGDPAPLLARCLDVAPHYLMACSDYAVVLINRGMHIEALPYLERLHAHDRDNAMVAALLAKCLGQMGNFERAIELHQTAGEAFDSEPALLLTYAEALKHAGRREDSVTIHRICLEADPGQGMAWWGLANVKTEPFSAEDVRTMRAQLARADLAPRDRYHLHYALGRAYEQARDYEASFTAYAAGAALKKAEVGYDDSELPELGRRMKAFFTAERLAAMAGWGNQDPAPIFILGLPRAGSTLVEQILASHSQVEGTVEMPEISNLVRDIGLTPRGMIYPECLADYDPADIAALGARFLERSRVYRKTGRPFFIDKMPANWAHIGLIHAMLPNAKIIDARREPMANCFAAYKQLFGHGVHYSYDFGDLARYYKAYLDRMAHFDSVLPGRIHRVQYEDMVNQTEQQVRALLDYCGLAFEPACLRFWESKRAVATPSAEQVRQPIFREGLDQWRHYEPWLGKLRAALA